MSVLLSTDVHPEQVRALFDALADLPRGERVLRLAALDPEVRRKVEALLDASDAHDASVDDQLGGLVRASAAQLSSPSSGEGAASPSDDPLIGRTVGPYEVVDVLGAGGMGIVYLARDPRLGRRVVLKMLPPAHQTDPTAQRRLRREARAASALDHPNVATIFDLGTTDGGRHYVAMAYVEGDTLAERLREGPLSVDAAVDVVTQIARGLGAIHAKGIVHRDVKPSNVIVTPDGTVKIVDFGIAKMAGTDLTQTGATPGTAAYMSPEQVRGDDIDARADLWALGVLAYEMLTGHRPFQGSNTASLLHAITHGAPTPIWKHRPDLPRPLVRIVDALLQKDADARLASARNLLDALSSIESTARRSARPSAARHLGRRGVWIGAALAILVIALGLSWGVYAWTHTGVSSVPPVSAVAGATHEQVRSIAVLPIEDLSVGESRTAFATGMTDALITTLSKVESFRVIARRSVMRFNNQPVPPSEIASELGVDFLIDGAILREGDRVRVSAHLLQRGSDVPMWTEVYEQDVRNVLTLQRDVARAIAGAVEVQLTPADERRLDVPQGVDPEAYELYLWGQHFRNREHASSDDSRRAVSYFDQAIQKDPTFAPAYAAKVISGMGFKIWEDEIREAATTALRLDPTLADAHVAQGLVHELLDWNWPAAERRFQQALELNPSSVEAHYEYGLLLLRTARFEAAREHFEAALRLDPLSVLTQLAMVRYFYFTGQHDRALDLVDRVLELDPDHLATHSDWLPLIHAARGDRAAALAAVTRAEEIAEIDGEFAATRLHVAAIVGDRATAWAYVDRAQVHAAQHPEDSTYVSFITGIAEAHLGNLDVAYDHLTRVRDAQVFHLVRLLYSPLFAPFRADPRFDAYRAGLGLSDPNTRPLR